MTRHGFMRVLHAKVAADRARIVKQASEAGASPQDIDTMLRWHAEQSAHVIERVRREADDFFGTSPVMPDEAEIEIGGRRPRAQPGEACRG